MAVLLQHVNDPVPSAPRGAARPRSGSRALGRADAREVAARPAAERRRRLGGARGDRDPRARRALAAREPHRRDASGGAHPAYRGDGAGRGRAAEVLEAQGLDRSARRGGGARRRVAWPPRSPGPKAASPARRRRTRPRRSAESPAPTPTPKPKTVAAAGPPRLHRRRARDDRAGDAPPPRRRPRPRRRGRARRGHHRRARVVRAPSEGNRQADAACGRAATSRSSSARETASSGSTWRPCPATSSR